MTFISEKETVLIEIIIARDNYTLQREIMTVIVEIMTVDLIIQKFASVFYNEIKNILK